MSERHMFVNYDDETLDIEIKAYDNVTIYKMLPEGEEIEEVVDTEEVPQNEQYVIFEMHIPAGTIYGFRVESTPDYTNPDTEHLTIVTAGGKTPWPTPPPPPPPAYDRTGYADRAADFLIALSGERPKQQGQRAKPAGPTEPTAST